MIILETPPLPSGKGWIVDKVCHGLARYKKWMKPLLAMDFVAPLEESSHAGRHLEMVREYAQGVAPDANGERTILARQDPRPK